MKTVRIVVIDDHPVISHGVRGVLEKNEGIDVVGQAHDAGEARRVVERTRPDVIILDISLGGGDGVSLMADLLQESPHSRVVMYTMHDEPVYVSRSFQAGALGYVLKSGKMAELEEAVFSASRNSIYLSPGVPHTVLSELMTGKSRCRSPVDALTRREYEVAALIARGMKPEIIAEKLHISPRTVRVHRTNIMHKFYCEGIHELLLQLRHYFPQ